MRKTSMMERWWANVSQISENVARIRDEIAEAALASGREPGQIVLCAATKMNGTAAIREAICAGVQVCGENRVQELLQKLPEGAYDGVPVHMIGHLQKNKVRQVVGQVALIQSADSPELLAAINRQAEKLGLRQEVLLEINIAREPQKSGLDPALAAEVCAGAAEFSGIFVRGLMAIPPVSEKSGDNRRFFAEMRKLFVDISAKKYDNVSMDILSMGMSRDYPDAIAEGSTMVRLGTAIFGPRNYA